MAPLGLFYGAIFFCIRVLLYHFGYGCALLRIDKTPL